MSEPCTESVEASGAMVTGDYLISGITGIGKTPVVQAFAAAKLAQSRPVVILDIGRSYLDFCRAQGGTYVRPGEDDWTTVEPYGKTPLYVCDFDFGFYSGSLPFPVARAIGVPDGLLVVDEVWNIRRRYPGLLDLVRMHVAGGGRFCVVGQSENDVAPFSGLSMRTRLLTLALAPEEV
ncbi:hypothetical protein G3A43_08105 [Paraburkholderia aspalathi]|nr:hypothetical protein [Paraburkholderia aspalathi]MBK3780219.1 hypothetical protein [Paraburkholderia aspalathi]